jgi:hypothetical protein
VASEVVKIQAMKYLMPHPNGVSISIFERNLNMQFLTHRSLFISLLAFAFVTMIQVGLKATPQSEKAQEASTNVKEASDDLNKLYDSKSLTFKDANDESTFLKAVRKLSKTNELMKEVVDSLSSKQQLDGLIAQARVLQKLIGAYFGEKEFGGTYELRQDAIDLNIEVDASIQEILRKKLPFVHMGEKGHISYKPGREIVSQLNSLRTELFGVLSDAAHIDPSDSRIKTIADWSTNTKVKLGRDDFMGTEIIDVQDVWSLKLR